MLLFDNHDLICRLLDSFSFAWMQGFRLGRAPAIVRTDLRPNLGRWLHLVKLHIDCEAAVRTVETHWLAIGRACLVSIDIHMQEPFDVMVNCHVALGFHVSMALVPELEAIILHADLNSPQIVSTLKESTVLHAVCDHESSEHWNSHRICQASQASQIFAPS